MLNLESILCSMKSLIIGIPLGVTGSFLVYNALEMPVEFSYAIPWLPIIGCVGGVFVITWATMRYAASRLREGNIVETIRGESNY
jgi:putative ABC transport system permease protein